MAETFVMCVHIPSEQRVPSCKYVTYPAGLRLATHTHTHTYVRGTLLQPDQQTLSSSAMRTAEDYVN